MPKVSLDLNGFSPAAAEALYHRGRYMEDAAYRNDNTYYWARLSEWYLREAGIPGQPGRAPTQAELNGLRKIPVARQNTLRWVVNQLRAGRSPNDLSFIDATPARFANAVRSDAELTAAILYLKEQLGTANATVEVLSPTFNELWERARNIDSRPPAQRYQSMQQVHQWAEALRAQEQHQTGAAALPDNEYDVVRVQDMMSYLDENYDAAGSPLEAPASHDHQYGPAPVFDGV